MAQYNNKHYTHTIQILDIICIRNNASPAVGATEIVSSSFTFIRKIRGLQKNIRRLKENWRLYHRMNKIFFFNIATTYIFIVPIYSCILSMRTVKYSFLNFWYIKHVYRNNTCATPLSILQSCVIFKYSSNLLF